MVPSWVAVCNHFVSSTETRCTVAPMVRFSCSNSLISLLFIYKWNYSGIALSTLPQSDHQSTSSEPLRTAHILVQICSRDFFDRCWLRTPPPTLPRLRLAPKLLLMHARQSDLWSTFNTNLERPHRIVVIQLEFVLQHSADNWTRDEDDDADGDDSGTSA